MNIPLIKICGLTRAEDIRLCEEYLVDYLGFIFVPSSPRSLTIERAQELRRVVTRTMVVGVFVDEDPVKIMDYVRAVSLNYVQLHGHEPIEVLGKITVPVIKAFRSVPPVAELELWINAGAKILLDGPKNGRSADWESIAALPVPIRRQLFLAGGLSIGNVAEAVERIAPLAIDVCSGVESMPGVKDADRLRQCIEHVRSPFLPVSD